jgi:hypothetical protein
MYMLYALSAYHEARKDGVAVDRKDYQGRYARRVLAIRGHQLVRRLALISTPIATTTTAALVANPRGGAVPCVLILGI